MTVSGLRVERGDWCWPRPGRRYCSSRPVFRRATTSTAPTSARAPRANRDRDGLPIQVAHYRLLVGVRLRGAVPPRPGMELRLPTPAVQSVAEMVAFDNERVDTLATGCACLGPCRCAESTNWASVPATRATGSVSHLGGREGFRSA